MDPCIDNDVDTRRAVHESVASIPSTHSTNPPVGPPKVKVAQSGCDSNDFNTKTNDVSPEDDMRPSPERTSKPASIILSSGLDGVCAPNNSPSILPQEIVSIPSAKPSSIQIPSTKCGLLDLSPETRLRVYEEVFTQPDNFKLRYRQRPSLVRTCKLIHAEAKPILLKTTVYLKKPTTPWERQGGPPLSPGEHWTLSDEPADWTPLIRSLPNLKYIEAWVYMCPEQDTYMYASIHDWMWSTPQGVEHQAASFWEGVYERTWADHHSAYPWAYGRRYRSDSAGDRRDWKIFMGRVPVTPRFWEEEVMRLNSWEGCRAVIMRDQELFGFMAHEFAL